MKFIVSRRCLSVVLARVSEFSPFFFSFVCAVVAGDGEWHKACSVFASNY